MSMQHINRNTVSNKCPNVANSLYDHCLLATMHQHCMDQGLRLIPVDKKQHISPLDGKFRKQRKKIAIKSAFHFSKESLAYRRLPRQGEAKSDSLSKYYQLEAKPPENVLASVSLALTNWLPQLWSGSQKENAESFICQRQICIKAYAFCTKQSESILCVCVFVAVCRKSTCPTKLITINIEWVLIMVNLH